MRSGITPVVAVVLLLMMTVAAAGGAYAWFSQIQESAQDEASTALDTRLDVRDLRCDDADVTLTASNTGDAEIEDASANAYLYQDGELLTDGDVDLTGRDVVTPGGVSDLPLPFTLDPGTSYLIELRFPRSGVALERTCRGRRDRLVGHWDFEAKRAAGPRDTAGGNHGTFSNNERDGTLVNVDFDDTSGWTRGTVGSRAIRLDGANDAVEVSHTGIFNRSFGGSLNFTLSAWAHPLEWENYAVLVQKASCGSWSCTTAGIWAYSNGFRGVIGSDESGNPPGSHIGVVEQPPLDSWYHVAAVGNDTHLIFYRDGSRVGTAQITDYIKDNLTANTATLTMGPRHSGRSESFNGSIDEVRVYDRNLSDAAITDLAGKEDVRDGLIGEWTFEEGSGGTVHDTSIWVDGREGDYGLAFNGENQYFTYNAVLGTSPSTYTFATWAKIQPDSSDSRQNFIMHGDTALTYLRYDGSTFEFTVHNGTSWYRTDGVSPTFGEWYHVVGTFDNGDLTLYVNGTRQDTNTISGTPTSSGNTPTIGAFNEASSPEDVNGTLDGVRIYDTALTAEQVASLYEAAR